MPRTRLRNSTPPPGRSRALYEEFRARIAGSYAAGAALPSTRALAAERGLSRATVSGVYEQLATDGFIDSRPGAASRVATGVAGVASVAGAAGQRPATPARVTAANPPAGPLSAIGQHLAGLQLPALAVHVAGEIDFGYGALAGQDFPTLAWLKALRAVERQRSPRLAYEDPMGHLALRKALQAHLAQTRGMACAVEQLMIVSGSQQALDLCARLLLNPGDAAMVENPGYRIAHHCFEAYGARCVGVDVDSQGLRTGQLQALGAARLAYVTPTHQFPLGSFLPMARRRQLLEWAAQHRAWVIEDDYDSEYRYALRPEATLQSLDPQGRVIHVGTFSKTLSPQLRLGYLVLPPALVQAFAHAKRLSDRHAATGAQRALARLLEDGSYSRHVRRLRRLQQARQRALVEALQRHLGDQAEVQGTASGLHLVLWLHGLQASQEPALAAAALARGLRVYPLGPYFHPGSLAAARERPAGLVMGYALLEPERIEVGGRRLAEALREVGQKAGSRHR